MAICAEKNETSAKTTNVVGLTATISNTFFNFFDVDPITLHGYISDAANPLLITSLIQRLKNNISSKDSKKSACDAFKLGKEHTWSPNLAIMEVSYGTGFGPLAYNAPCPWSSTVACGTKPVVVRTDSGEIDKQVKRAKTKHCVALIIEIVRARDGCVMTSEQWDMTVQACRKHHMILIVDEARTAIRCGAPFAHQLPEYKRRGRPDFILFGKGIRTSGIAIDWKGVNVGILRKITSEEQVDVIVMWQKRYRNSASGNPTPILGYYCFDVTVRLTSTFFSYPLNVKHNSRELLLKSDIDLGTSQPYLVTSWRKCCR